MVTADPVPASARVYRLRTRLIQLRKAKGLTCKEVGRRMGKPSKPLAESTVYRWETPHGAARLDWKTVMALCKVYEADDSTTEALIALAQDSEVLLGWLESYGGAPTPYLGTLLGFEATARRIGIYHNGVIPGLLQTEDYARPLIAAAVPRVDAAEVQRRLSIRSERQTSVLDRADPPQVWAVLTEGVLRQRIVDRAAMRAQLDRLLELSERPNITLQVHGFECAATPATGAGPIAVFWMPDTSEPPVVYLEMAADGLFVEHSFVDRYAEILDHVRASALAPAESQTRIATVARDLK